MEQLSRHRRQPPRRVLITGDVLGMGSIEGLHHLDAKAGTVGEEHGELGYGERGWKRDAGRLMRAVLTSTPP